MGIKYWVIDVDGTMTDGGIYYDENGNELKKFCTKDAAAFFVAQALNMKIIILTGRESEATKRRMAELKVDCLVQNVKDKTTFLRKFMKENSIAREELGYIGDDLNDYEPMQLAGFVGCPADSCLEIKKIAHYISPCPGGHGAVRDVIETLLRKEGQWDNAIVKAYQIGI